MRMSGYAYTASAGESFDSVALGVYGNECYAAELLTANPKLADRIFFTGGEVLLLPVVEAIPSGDALTASATAPWKE